MPLYKTTPKPSGRMGVLWSLAPIYDTAIIEYGSMGHMIYAHKWMGHTGLTQYADLITTHLAEKDIALGLTKKLEDAVVEVIKKGQAKAIFLLPSSVPEMIGTDLEAIGEELQFSYPQIPIVTLKAGNFKATKEQGIEEAFYQLVKSLPEKVELLQKESEETSLSFNLFGTTCDWSRFQADAREIGRIMEGAFSMKKAAVFGSGSSFDSILTMAKADVTLVMRKEGLKAAKFLEKEYAIPYVYCAPYGLLGTLDWLHELEKILDKKTDLTFLETQTKETQAVINHCKIWTNYARDKANIWVSEEDELAKGLQNFAKEELGFSLTEGGIHMSDLHELKSKQGKYNIEIRRSTLSYDINPYELPFMGFRGAMNLGALWYRYFTE